MHTSVWFTLKSDFEHPQGHRIRTELLVPNPQPTAVKRCFTCCTWKKHCPGIMGSFKALVWALLLLFIIIYVTGSLSKCHWPFRDRKDQTGQEARHVA